MDTPPEATPPSLPEPQAPGPHQQASTRAERRLQFRAALLLLTLVGLLVAAALYLMWARGAFDATQRLVLTTDDSEGVVVGMDMTFSGFPIGRVAAIELGKDANVRILVDVPVADAHWLRQSSVFTLERGLVGAARLRAFTGVLDDPPLPAGAERPVLRGDVSAEIPRMVSDARVVLQNAAQLTGADSALSKTLADLNSFSQRLAAPQKGGLLGAVTGNEADARRVAELLDHTNQLVKNLDSVARSVDTLVRKADRQVLGQNGKDGLVPEAQAAVQQLNALLQDARQTIAKVDTVLKDVQGVTSNAREATENLGDLRADVESSLLKIDALITELNRKWPFAPKQKEVKLP
ncbi:MlaD family protein [Ottowia sp.]|uniref:MlaD family protein n=1 Tax=Ottowia sp. TaxID=1898956 RepID=UPI00262BEEAB|nr:MlaD family protein [Ottowia sp.]